MSASESERSRVQRHKANGVKAEDFRPPVRPVPATMEVTLQQMFDRARNWMSLCTRRLEEV
jgi:hypothetical protein